MRKKKEKKIEMLSGAYNQLDCIIVYIEPFVSAKLLLLP